MEDIIYQYCRDLLLYVDPCGEVIHDHGCHPSEAAGCNCGLDATINNIRTEIEIKNIEE